MAIEGSELVSDMGRDAGLDSSRSNRNEPESCDEPGAGFTGHSHEGEGAVAQAVDH